MCAIHPASTHCTYPVTDGQTQLVRVEIYEYALYMYTKQ